MVFGFLKSKPKSSKPPKAEEAEQQAQQAAELAESAELTQPEEAAQTAEPPQAETGAEQPQAEGATDDAQALQPDEPAEQQEADESQAEEAQQPTAPAEQVAPPPTEEPAAEPTQQLKSINKSFFGKLRQIVGMSDKSLEGLATNMEEELLMADFGLTMTNKIISKWRESASFISTDNNDKDSNVAMQVLAQILEETLASIDHKLPIPSQNRPFCLMVMGVNGSGKTTSIAKMAHHYKHQGFKLQLAAGDTYRAAAVEQLEHWANKLQIAITKGDGKTESAAVIYKGFMDAKANQADIYLMDTSGRMPNDEPLKQQLRKCIQVVNKLAPEQQHEILLVLDASHGQSALMQARLFCEAVPVSGIALTKLDGAAKGGVIFALVEELKLPIRFIGVGEKESDLLEFDAKSYIKELISEN